MMCNMQKKKKKKKKKKENSKLRFSYAFRWNIEISYTLSGELQRFLNEINSENNKWYYNLWQYHFCNFHCL